MSIPKTIVIQSKLPFLKCAKLIDPTGTMSRAVIVCSSGHTGVTRPWGVPMVVMSVVMMTVVVVMGVAGATGWNDFLVVVVFCSRFSAETHGV